MSVITTRKQHRSNELREYFKQIQDILDYDLKMKTVTYMMDNQVAIIDDPEILNTSNTDAPENFRFVCKNW
jgi:archaellum component FlaG (FlaF/FlaG flagellin family)